MEFQFLKNLVNLINANLENTFIEIKIAKTISETLKIYTLYLKDDFPSILFNLTTMPILTYADGNTLHPC